MNDILQFVVLLLMTVSVVLQFCAAFLALRLLRPSRGNVAWIMISLVLALMAVRQTVSFYNLMTVGVIHPAELYGELIEFVTSLLLVAGLFSISPLIRRFYSGSAADDTESGQISLGELFEKITSGIAVYEAIDKGSDFIIRDINPAAERIEKMARQHMVGRRVTEVFPGVDECGLLEVLRRVWKTGRAENLPLHYYQDSRISGWRDNFVYRRAGGEVVAVYDDVSVQVHMKDELERREQKFRLLFEKAPLPYMSLDGDGLILEVNPAWLRLTGLVRGAASGHPFSELLSRTGRQHLQDCLDKIKQEGSVSDVALELRRSDGMLTDVEMDALSVPGKKGNVEQICCMLRETSGETATSGLKAVAGPQARMIAEKILAGEFQDLQRKRIALFGELTSGIAYEFNTPLAAARNALSLMRKGLPASGQAGEFAEIVSKELNRMADLIEQMYRFHRPMPSECERLNINAMLDNTLLLVKAEMKARRIRLQDERKADLPSVRLPPEPVMQILINPVRNSVEALPPDGILTLRSGADDQNGVFVEIEDNGAGMSPEFLPHLFEPFTVLHHRGTKHDGAGLGMALTYHLLNALGGTVKVRSTEGEGTCVRIFLPAEMKNSKESNGQQPA